MGNTTTKEEEGGTRTDESEGGDGRERRRNSTEGGGTPASIRNRAASSFTDRDTTGRLNRTLSLNVSTEIPVFKDPFAKFPKPTTPEGKEAETVPVVFRWDHGGDEVYLTGSFAQWKAKIPMHRSGNDFTYIVDLPKDMKQHTFKFIVDNEWRYAADLPTIPDEVGNLNNFIDLGDFKTYQEDEELIYKHRAETGSVDDGLYAKVVPDLEEYAKDPPTLPAQLRWIVLNGGKGSRRGEGGSSDPKKLATPIHVSLNHLFCSVIKDGIMVQGITSRYKRKFTTTVYYSLERNQ